MTDDQSPAESANLSALSDLCTPWCMHVVSKGVFAEPVPGQFALNKAALEVQRFGLNLDGIGGRIAHAWGTLLTAVRTGTPAYHERFGLPFWEDLQAHPDIAASFDALMGPAGHGIPDPEVLLTG